MKQEGLGAPGVHALPSHDSLSPITRLQAWLLGLQGHPRAALPPREEDARHLDSLLLDVWDLAGGRHWARGSAAQASFRQQVGPFLWRSPLLQRCWTKPRGYAGDFQMMEAIYQREPGGDTALGRWLDAWSLELPGFQAVRNRKERVSQLLLAEHRRGARRVMNVACGSAPELRPVLREAALEAVTLLDQDQGALDAALAGLEQLPSRATPPERVRPWCGSVLALLRSRSELPRASQDVIYSIGLYDYLSARFARHLTAQLWGALAPGGLLVLGNFNDANPMHHFIEHALDWYLVYRGPEELLELVDALPDLASAHVETEPTGCLHLLVARKAG